MDNLSDEQLAAYLATGDWEGKAGAFGYQDGLDWVHVASGSESNVVGLPMELLSRNAGRSRQLVVARSCRGTGFQPVTLMARMAVPQSSPRVITA